MVETLNVPPLAIKVHAAEAFTSLSVKNAVSDK